MKPEKTEYAKEEAALKALIYELIAHPEALDIEAQPMGSRSVSFLIQAHVADTSRLIGSGGKTYRAIAAIMAAAGAARRYNIRVPSYREPKIGQPEQYRFVDNPCWPKDRISGLVKQLAELCFSGPCSVQVFDGERDSAIEVVLSHREDARVVQALGEHFKHVFDAIGKANGRLISVSLIQRRDDAEPQWQPKTAAGRYAAE